MSTTTCVLCRVDEYECDEGTRRALFFLIGKSAPEDVPLCEAHESKQAFALVNLAFITGHGEWAPPIQKALDAPKLRLVPAPSESKADP